MIVEPRTTPGHGPPSMQDTYPVPGTSREKSTVIGVLAAVLVAVMVILAAWAFSGPARTVETLVPALPAQHDSVIAQLVSERDRAFAAHHDSGIARLLRERDEALEAQHDSGIARLLRERDEALNR